MTSKRVKPEIKIPVIKSLEEADAILGRIAELGREVDMINIEMNAEIDEAKRNAESLAEPYKQEVSELNEALVRYATFNRDELFKKKKSLQLTFGSIGFRSSTSLKLLSKWTWKKVLQTLHDLSMNTCIRNKPEVDREALKILSEDKLKAVGCRIVQEDQFFYELSEQNLEGDDAA